MITESYVEFGIIKMFYKAVEQMDLGYLSGSLTNFVSLVDDKTLKAEVDKIEVRKKEVTSLISNMNKII